MSEIAISTDENEDMDSEVKSYHIQNNRKKFEKFLKLCRNNKQVPMKYIEDIDKMFRECNNKEISSSDLCNLILEGIKHISPQNTDSFRYVADVYNELLQLSKKDSASLLMDNCSASTSITGVSLENKDNIDIHKSNGIFQKLIEKCYQNPNFPNSHITLVYELYKSLPPEFVQSKYFVAMLEEANNKIWPDSSASLYVHIEIMYDQLNQFKTSMEAQSSIVSNENDEIYMKKLKKLKKLKVALKKIRKSIKDLGETEMDINNENEYDVNSAYILKDKYEKRALEIYKRMCKLRNEPDFLEAPPLCFRETNNKLVNKTIEKYYNLNKSFPDYYEIFNLLKMLNEKKNLKWSETELNNISHDAFVKLGKQLKIQRLDEYFDSLIVASTDKDPAEENPELKKKLEESSKKLESDLIALGKKFISKQEETNETDGSSLNNTDCEISSDEEYKNNASNKKANLIPVKRKRSPFNESNNDTLQKKNKKTLYMESFNLTPCVMLEDLHNVKKKTYDTNEVPNLASKESNIDVNNSKISSDNDSGNKLCIDENIIETVTKIPQENKVSVVERKNNNLDTSTIIINSEDNEPIVTEPEILIHEDIIPTKDVIEINELDDSDVEITDSNVQIVPVQSKKSLESIIHSMNFHKKYNWSQQPVEIANPNSNFTQSHDLPNHKLNRNSSYNNFINCWIMNNGQSLRPNIMYARHPNPLGTNRLPTVSHGIQSSIQNSTTQTARQVTRFLNSVQQRNFTNNQSFLSQRVTTMTTTTTVHQVVQQQSSRPLQRRIGFVGNESRQVNIPKNNCRKPELIEID